MSGDQYTFDTRHDRYPVAAHAILTDPAGRVLLARRAGSGYADGQLAFPAGHVDLGETPIDCLVREIREELGIELDPASITPAGTMFRLSQEPRVDLFFTIRAWDGMPRICEPHKCAELVWVTPDELPGDALDFVGRALANRSAGRPYDEFGWATTSV
ncbi:NUDIX hydrolase [Actinomadura harenae]|uniref:NUDIX domain-containing protein n=1 Tax=Actinomadura harenae TaxID=2483351 RepID=A0A3M2LP89_9ACTN|nr:NUDIX domain-containing protein [Actinomadura harenae]RMI39291.1 NUDIX domain-containing protein [Actinomadura harenae]